MADNKPKRIKMVSPRGTFVWPRLDEPDYGNEKYPKPDGEFSVQLRMEADNPAMKTFIAKLQPFHDAAVKAAEAKFKELKVDQRKKLGKVTVNDLYRTIYDEETEEPTGEIVFKFTMKAGGTTKKGKVWSQKPTVVDAKGTTMKKVPKVGSGTVGKVSFDFTEDGFFIAGTGAAGLSLSLLGAQIIDLVTAGARTAKDLGFTEEDGYEYEEGDFSDETTGSEDGGDATSDEDQDF
jgi:hypothetical protein